MTNEKTIEKLKQLEKEVQLLWTQLESIIEPTPQKTTCWEDAFRRLNPRYYLNAESEVEINGSLPKQIDPVEGNRNSLPTAKDCEEALKFIQRRLIAVACGSREFVPGGINWGIHYSFIREKWSSEYYEQVSVPGNNYFPTKEAAEEYLQACINSGLL